MHLHFGLVVTQHVVQQVGNEIVRYSLSDT